MGEQIRTPGAGLAVTSGTVGTPPAPHVPSAPRGLAILQNGAGLNFRLPPLRAVVDLVDLAVGLPHGLVERFALMSDPLAVPAFLPAPGRKAPGCGPVRPLLQGVRLRAPSHRERERS